MSSSNEKSLGKYIAEARKNLQLSQKELAERIKKEDGEAIAPQYLNDIEKDRRNPSSDHIIGQFAKELDLDKEYLHYLAGSWSDDARSKNLDEKEFAKAFKLFRRS